VIVNGSEPEYFESSQPEIVRYEIAKPERKGTIERLQETVIESVLDPIRFRQHEHGERLI